MSNLFTMCAVLLIVLSQAMPVQGGDKVNLSPIEQVGKLIFYDQNLSDPPGQACAACHGPTVGFTGPDQAINAGGAVYEGAVPGRFGNRKPPSAAYAGDSPILHLSTISNHVGWIGGMFWDGRATGMTLLDPLAEQAQGPFLNPLEQNNPDAKAVVQKVANSCYAPLFLKVWGPDSLNLNDINGAYERIARSIAAYERSSEVSAFSSKYDLFLQKKIKLTGQEMRGLQLFEGKAGCANCHVSQPGPNGEPPLFTDYSYDNLGLPKNPHNPFYNEPDFNPLGENWIDYGLGGYLKSAGYSADVYEPQLGKMKVPTLRNVDKRPDAGFIKAYGHNGYFKSLDEIVNFYNTAGVPGKWPAPEVPMNVNRTELGNLGLTLGEEKAIIAFLKTLSDGYQPHYIK